MGSRYANPDRKTFDKTPMSDLVFASANIIELAGYHTPDMPRNMKTTKEWRTPDIHQSSWRLETLQDIDPAVAEKFGGASPIEYKIYCQTLGSKACFVYRSDMELMYQMNPDNKTSSPISKEAQMARIPYFLEGLDGFPKDIAIAESPILESWRTPNPGLSGTEFNSNVFDTIIATNYGELPARNDASAKAKKSIVGSIRNWLSQPVD